MVQNQHLRYFPNGQALKLSAGNLDCVWDEVESSVGEPRTTFYFGLQGTTQPRAIKKDFWRAVGLRLELITSERADSRSTDRAGAK